MTWTAFWILSYIPMCFASYETLTRAQHSQGWGAYDDDGSYDPMGQTVNVVTSLFGPVSLGMALMMSFLMMSDYSCDDCEGYKTCDRRVRVSTKG